MPDENLFKTRLVKVVVPVERTVRLRKMIAETDDAGQPIEVEQLVDETVVDMVERLVEERVPLTPSEIRERRAADAAHAARRAAAAPRRSIEARLAALEARLQPDDGR